MTFGVLQQEGMWGAQNARHRGLPQFQNAEQGRRELRPLLGCFWGLGSVKVDGHKKSTGMNPVLFYESVTSKA